MPDAINSQIWDKFQPKKCKFLSFLAYNYSTKVRKARRTYFQDT